jgi:hypothetical protein
MTLAAAAGGFAAGLVVGVAAGTHLRPSTRTPAPAPAPARASEPSPPSPSPSPPSPTATGDASGADAATLRKVLDICIDQADRLRDQNEALWRQFNSRLALVDVEVIIADGETFDSERHDATGREATTDPGRHLTVASTELVGYRRNGQYLRRPQVVVYRADLG